MLVFVRGGSNNGRPLLWKLGHLSGERSGERAPNAGWLLLAGSCWLAPLPIFATELMERALFNSSPAPAHV